MNSAPRRIRLFKRMRFPQAQPLSMLFQTDSRLWVGCKNYGSQVQGDPLVVTSPPDWEIDERRPFRQFGHMYAMSTDPQDNYLGIGNWATASIVSLRDYSVVSTFKRHDENRGNRDPALVLGIVLCDDGTAVTCGTDLKYRKWRIADAEQIAEMEWKPLSSGSATELMYFRASANRKWVVTAEWLDKLRVRIQVRSTENLAIRSQWVMQPPMAERTQPPFIWGFWPHNITFLPGDERLLVASGGLQILDLEGRVVRMMDVPVPATFGSSCISPDGRVAAISCHEPRSREVALIEINSETVIANLSSGASGAYSVMAFSPDCCWLAGLQNVSCVDIWDVRQVIEPFAPMLPASPADAPTGLEPALPAKKKAPRKKKSG